MKGRQTGASPLRKESTLLATCDEQQTTSVFYTVAADRVRYPCIYTVGYVLLTNFIFMRERCYTCKEIVYNFAYKLNSHLKISTGFVLAAPQPLSAAACKSKEILRAESDGTAHLPRMLRGYEFHCATDVLD
jgi:hypothetical protein